MTVDTDWARDWRHVFISGDTGSGKTVLGRQIHYETSRVSIFWNPMQVEMRESIIPFDIQEIIKRLYAGDTRLNIKPHWDEDEAKEQFEELLRLLYVLADSTKTTEYQVVIDECHQLAGKNETNSPLNRAVKEGRNKRIKVVSLSQEPQLVSHSVLRQSRRHIWIGPPNAYAEDYFSNFHIDTNSFAQSEADLHLATLLDERMEVIGQFVADEKYVM